MADLRDWLGRRGLGWFRGGSRASAADVGAHERRFGVGREWAPVEYGEYYQTSVPVYAAVRLRAMSLARLPWKVMRVYQTGGPLDPGARGDRVEVAVGHPLRRLLDRPNSWMTAAELREATETYLLLWGRAFWTIERDEHGEPEIWPVRPDRMTVVPGADPQGRHVRGYLYTSEMGQEIAFLPDEVVAFTLFNPMKERTGQSPVAPVRLSVDMGRDALRYNRNTFRYASVPDFLMIGEGTMTQQEVDDFYKRWEARYSGPAGMRRPAIASSIKGVEKLAFSQREMEFLESLRWTVSDVCRVFGVPETMLSLLQNATLQNTDNLEKTFWRNTMVPQTRLYQDRMNTFLLPQLGFPLHEVEFDFTSVEVLGEAEDARLRRELGYLEKGVMSVNEVRRSRGLADVAGGDTLAAPAAPGSAGEPGAGRNGARAAAALAGVLGAEAEH